MIVFGIEGHAFVNPTPDSALGAGGWIDMTIIRNITVSRQKKEVDVTVRRSTYVLTDMKLIQASLQVELPLDIADTGYQALETAYATKTPVSLSKAALLTHMRLTKPIPTILPPLTIEES